METMEQANLKINAFSFNITHATELEMRKERESSPEVRAVVISEQGEAWKAFVTFFALVFLLHC